MTKYIVTVDEYGTRRWYNGSDRLTNMHRTDGPAVEFADGGKCWYLNGELHRTDGPAIEYAKGDKYWYLNGELHRTDGPAMEFADGTKSWCLNNKLHRTDGPAIERPDVYKFWYLNGVKLTESEFLTKTKKASCEGKEVEVDGVKYKLVKA